MTSFVPGQRWFSTAEPELGLGTVLRTAGRGVQIVFTGSGMLRQYAIGSAPLVRAEFRVGDRVQVDGRAVEISAVEAGDVLHYVVEGRRIAEGELDAEQPVSQADQRLLAGRSDRNDQFEFRLAALQRRALARAHPGWGVLGARIDLIPHQLRVAEIAAARRPPRLLLADEVGLGKTIEACLVLAQLLASGRAGRALVLVPESLVHQWFVELKRRFNLAFSVFDEERCEAIEQGQPGSNPFEDGQLIIAATGWLSSNPTRAAQLRAAGWDALVVDEAHHLAWSPDAPSPGYQLVDALAAHTPAVILLTATPEQLGIAGHFARLRLLDPARYSDLEAFRDESARFLRLSELVDALHAGDGLPGMEFNRASFRDHLGRIWAGAVGGAAGPSTTWCLAVGEYKDDLATRPGFVKAMRKAIDIALEEGIDPTALGVRLDDAGEVIVEPYVAQPEVIIPLNQVKAAAYAEIDFQAGGARKKTSVRRMLSVPRSNGAVSRRAP